MSIVDADKKWREDLKKVMDSYPMDKSRAQAILIFEHLIQPTHEALNKDHAKVMAINCMPNEFYENLAKARDFREKDRNTSIMQFIYALTKPEMKASELLALATELTKLLQMRVMSEEMLARSRDDPPPYSK